MLESREWTSIGDETVATKPLIRVVLLYHFEDGIEPLLGRSSQPSR